MSAPFQNMFKMRRPCENCPFLNVGAIELTPGRIKGIIDTLVSDHHSTFHCHKTVHNGRTGGEWDDEGNYVASGDENMCAGAMIYLEKLGRPTVGMRVGRVLRMYSPDDLTPHFEAVLDPVN